MSQGKVAAYYAGAPIIDWVGERPDAVVLRIDCSVEDGVRVTPCRLSASATRALVASFGHEQ